MALKAGYYGVKKNVMDELKQLDGAKIIKSVGAGLNFSDAGQLSCKSATANQAGIAKSTDYLSSSMLAQLPLSFTEDIETSEINGIEVQFDTVPTDNAGDIANNLITSKGVFDALLKKLDIQVAALTGSDDLDTFTSNGIFSAKDSVPAHSPAGLGYYVLLVFHVSDTTYATQQLVLKGTDIYVRNYGGSPVAWTNWYKISGTAVTP